MTESLHRALAEIATAIGRLDRHDCYQLMALVAEGSVEYRGGFNGPEPPNYREAGAIVRYLAAPVGEPLVREMETGGADDAE